VADVPVPGPGTIKGLTGHPGGGPCAWFSYTDDRTPPGVYRLDARSGEVTEWAAPPGVARSPAFNPLRLAWVEAGGVYAIANVRGGGEEGKAWHRAGRQGNQQNSVDDFHAAGDYLVEQGWTTRGQLGIHGGSAGGLLAAAALAQRPRDYAAALCSAPVIDLVRSARIPGGGLWVSEYGRPDDPTEFGWLLAASPYQRVRPGEAYPATLFTVFEGDSRVDPLHARKFAAALQHATSAPAGQRPILLRREFGVGHINRAVSRSIPLWLDQLGFFALQLGLTDRPEDG
jgi:prolyl oligopeptidase